MYRRLVPQRPWIRTDMWTLGVVFVPRLGDWRASSAGIRLADVLGFYESLS